MSSLCWKLARVIKKQHILEKLEQFPVVHLNVEKISENFLELSSGTETKYSSGPFKTRSYNNKKLRQNWMLPSQKFIENVNRLTKSGLICKNPDGNYELTTF